MILPSEQLVLDWAQMAITLGGSNDASVFFEHPHSSIKIEVQNDQILDELRLMGIPEVSKKIQQLLGKKRAFFWTWGAVALSFAIVCGLALGNRSALLAHLIPFIPKKVDQVISMGVEEQLKAKNWKRLEVQHPQIHQQIKILLADRHPTETFKIRIYIDPSPIINARAYPGGVIVLNQGLIHQTLEDKDQLLGILAHEIVHIDQRHGIQGLVDQLGTWFLFSGLLNFGPSQANQVFSRLSQLSYGRQLEYEADIKSIHWMIEKKQNPSGLIYFLKNLNEQKKAKNRQPANWLQTHPSNDRRIDTIQSEINRHWTSKS
jgi:Zn-dependent protease with chaperone function